MSKGFRAVFVEPSGDLCSRAVAGWGEAGEPLVLSLDRRAVVTAWGVAPLLFVGVLQPGEPVAVLRPTALAMLAGFEGRQ